MEEGERNAHDVAKKITPQMCCHIICNLHVSFSFSVLRQKLRKSSTSLTVEHRGGEQSGSDANTAKTFFWIVNISYLLTMGVDISVSNCV